MIPSLLKVNGDLIIETGNTQEECCLKAEVECGILFPQGKECQALLATPSNSAIQRPVLPKRARDHGIVRELTSPRATDNMAPLIP